MTCKDCLSYELCSNRAYQEARFLGKDEKTYITIDHRIPCKFFKNKADFVEVVRCKDCVYSRAINRTQSPEKYFKDICIVCECENVVGDEPMIYLSTHFCSYGERKID